MGKHLGCQLFISTLGTHIDSFFSVLETTLNGEAFRLPAIYKHTRNTHRLIFIVVETMLNGEAFGLPAIYKHTRNTHRLIFQCVGNDAEWGSIYVASYL